MHRYRPKAPLAEAADKLLRALVAALLGTAWFVYLWGVRPTALTAGIAMGGLLWLAARQLGKKRMLRREAQMRQMIGGELALSRLMMLSPRHAAFQAALWLLPKADIHMEKALPWGVLGRWKEGRVLIRLIAQHESLPINVQQIIKAVRDAHDQEADRCILCVTAPVSREAAAYAEDLEMPIRIVGREELVALAGAGAPATDEQLRRMAQGRRHRSRSLRELLSSVLAPAKAGRYLWYGAGMGLLGILTRQWVYPIPAAVCLLLFLGCKIHSWQKKEESW
ncbi:MAG: hypothetical protein E7320_01435 [Clostridiales bacterium]|nr:hypothetical protein [Clostridiales bacterium]